MFDNRIKFNDLFSTRFRRFKKQINNVEKFLQEKDNVEVLFLPGSFSAKAFHIDKQSYDLYARAFLSKVCNESIIVGHSFGAAIGLSMFAQDQKRFKKVILVEPPLPKVFSSTTYIKTVYLFHRLSLAKYSPRVIKKLLLSKIFYPEYDLNPDDLVKLSHTILSKPDYGFLPKSYYRLVLLLGKKDKRIHPYKYLKYWAQNILQVPKEQCKEFEGDNSTLYIDPQLVLSDLVDN